MHLKDKFHCRTENQRHQAAPGISLAYFLVGTDILRDSGYHMGRWRLYISNASALNDVTVPCTVQSMSHKPDRLNSTNGSDSYAVLMTQHMVVGGRATRKCLA